MYVKTCLGFKLVLASCVRQYFVCNIMQYFVMQDYAIFCAKLGKIGSHKLPPCRLSLKSLEMSKAITRYPWSWRSWVENTKID